MPLGPDIALQEDVPSEVLTRVVDALYRVHKLISAITDLDSLLQQIMEESKQVTQAEACSLMLFDPTTEELYFHVALGEDGDQQALVREVRLKLGQGIAGACADSRMSINVPDAANDPRVFRGADEASKFTTKALLAVPMIDRDALVGVIELVNKRDGEAFTDIDLRTMEMFSGLAATAITNARLIEENLRNERLAAIGQTVAGLSHYTKNIITAMNGSSELMDTGLAKDDMELVRKCWPLFRRNTSRMSTCVEDMLAYCKPRPPLVEQYKIEELFDEVSDTFHGVLSRKTIELQIDAARLERPGRFDSRALYRCLVNLLGNAAEAVPEEGGVVRLAAYSAKNGDLMIDVADNGPGVPPENSHRVFEPFFSTKGSQGTGLGLAVTHKTVLEHGGTIQVLQAPEGGALFRIQLPQQEG